MPDESVRLMVEAYSLSAFIDVFIGEISRSKDETWENK